MATLSDKFIEERKEHWERIRTIILAIRRGGYRRLSSDDARDFPNLYRKICTDSETAKTLELAPDTCEYINTLVLQAHSLLYAPPKKSPSRFLRFFTYEFPHAFVQNLLPIGIIFLLFFGVGLASFFYVLFNPDQAAAIIGEGQVAFMQHAFAEEAIRTAEENVQMAGHYIINNVSIAFFSFVLGITFGILTLFIIFQNALIIGGALGVVVAHGHGGNLFSFIIAHGSFELLGICLAAGAGLSIGLSMILPTEEKRTTAIQNKAQEVMPIILVAAIFITIAAFIEGFISASYSPIAIKIAIAVVSFLIVVLYAQFAFIRRFFRLSKIKRKQKKQTKWLRKLKGGLRK
ncbi:MAG: stage II sporulation protein M [Spirochaetales bacterium]|nr:stage II sporulation protein M [Spirochaetales bacterium]